VLNKKLDYDYIVNKHILRTERLTLYKGVQKFCSCGEDLKQEIVTQ